ncbi:cation:proton antiporter [Inediibacterium massiliense]|uniref:cation:proton antiporter n=1 Tax=Inediibacterium massiliense TaxID=1658111 RepID=UPI0006B5567F|nr:cation:proton antiporter [Inediibacterium massiliense]
METAAIVATHKMFIAFVTVIIAGMVSGKISKFIKLPDVVLFLIAGIIIGPAGLNLIDIHGNAITYQLILTFGSAFILYDGGREIKLSILNNIKITVGLLSTVGVFLSALIMGTIIMYVFHIDFIYALLLGSVIASTDPATLVPVFQKVHIKDNVKQAVISESAFNDAAGAILVFSILTIIHSGTFSLQGNIVNLLIMILGGAAVGIIMGILFSFSIDEKYGIFKEYAPIISILGVVISFTLAEAIHGSGYMATFILGLVCGNKKNFGFFVPEENFSTQTHVRETLSLLMRMSIFILLGTHVDFIALSKYWKLSLVIVLILMFIARPIVVWVCTSLYRKEKWTLNDKLFITWVRETGVIPAALSGMITSMHIPHNDIISSVVFMTILVTLVVQASTTEYMAKKLKLLI